MTIARHFVMYAAVGKDSDLEAALRNLAGKLRTIAGCEAVELLQDIGNRSRFIFIEKWISVEAHKAGSQQLAQEDLAQLMAALDHQPEDSYFDHLMTI